jgi:hypothetical protein
MLAINRAKSNPIRSQASTNEAHIRYYAHLQTLWEEDSALPGLTMMMCCSGASSAAPLLSLQQPSSGIYRPISCPSLILELDTVDPAAAPEREYTRCIVLASVCRCGRRKSEYWDWLLPFSQVLLCFSHHTLQGCAADC